MLEIVDIFEARQRCFPFPQIKEKQPDMNENI